MCTQQSQEVGYGYQRSCPVSPGRWPASSSVRRSRWARDHPAHPLADRSIFSSSLPKGQGNGKILITGAIGDYGATHKASSGGKTLATATLKKGTITFDLTAITTKVNHATLTFDKATCSASFTESAPVPVVSGTGLYAGIHGTVRLTESFGFIGSTYKSGSKKGQCNLSNSAPTVAQMGEVYGDSTISF
jgi:hypothetical protein